jgi:hypothetical protein
MHQGVGLHREGYTQAFAVPNLWRHTQRWLVVCYFCPVELQLTLICVRILRSKGSPDDRLKHFRRPVEAFSVNDGSIRPTADGDVADNNR